MVKGKPGAFTSDEKTPDIDISDWPTPKQVLARIKPAHGDLSGEIILERLRGGFLIAIATQWSLSSANHSLRTGTGGPIDAGTWESLADGELWSTGAARFFWINNIGEGMTLRCVGIRFAPKTVEKQFSELPEPELVTQQAVPKSPPIQKHAGGAPRKEFWDDLWLAMFERLWLTDWKPKSQTEIENAMLDWATAHGYELGPTSVKKPAKKLFALCHK